MKLQTNQRPPKPKTLELQIDYSDSQLPFYEDTPDPNFEIFENHPPFKESSGYSGRSSSKFLKVCPFLPTYSLVFVKSRPALSFFLQESPLSPCPWLYFSLILFSLKSKSNEENNQRRRSVLQKTKPPP